MKVGNAVLYYLAPEVVKKLLVRKSGWVDGQPVHIEMVEICPDFCCFEWEGIEEFQMGDPLDIDFVLEESRLTTKASIHQVERHELLDSGYEHKTWFFCCARFDGELDSSFFGRIAGTQRVCRSSP